MTKFFLRWLINAVGLYVAILIVPGIEFAGNWINLLWLALIFGLLNALLRPLLGLLTCPLIILTLGLFTLVLNTFMLWLTSRIGESFNLGLTVNGFWPAFLGALVMSLVSIVLSLVLRDEMRGRRK
jgi:putative membrane protein